MLNHAIQSRGNGVGELFIKIIGISNLDLTKA